MIPDGLVTEERTEEAFVAGLCAMREMLARFVEQGGDNKPGVSYKDIATSMRLNWRASWGKDPGRPAMVADCCWTAPLASAKPRQIHPTSSPASAPTPAWARSLKEAPPAPSLTHQAELDQLLHNALVITEDPGNPGRYLAALIARLYLTNVLTDIDMAAIVQEADEAAEEAEKGGL